MQRSFLFKKYSSFQISGFKKIEFENVAQSEIFSLVKNIIKSMINSHYNSYY